LLFAQRDSDRRRAKARAGHRRGAATNVR